MVVKGKQLILQKFEDLERKLDEDRADVDYKDYLLRVLAEKMSGTDENSTPREIEQKAVELAESSRKRRGKDEEHAYNFYHDDEEEVEEKERVKDDPDYVSVLETLMVDGNSYKSECKRNGVLRVIKYEEASSSGTESDQEPRRKLRSALKQKDGPSSQMPHLENQDVLDSQSKMFTWKQTRSKSKSKRELNEKLSADKNVPHYTCLRSTLALKEDSSLDEECGQRSRRTPRSGTKQNNEHLNQLHDVGKNDSQSTPTVEKKNLTRRSRQNKSKSENDEEIFDVDHQYYDFCNFLELVDGRVVYNDGINVIAYEDRKKGQCNLEKEEHELKSGERNPVKEEHELKSGERNPVNEEHADLSNSDVEIIDSTAFYKIDKSSSSNHRHTTWQSEFRHKVITAFRKPFDREEFEKLWRDIKLQKPKKRHIDLRCGRERTIETQEDGKSYLDYYPVIRSKLSEAKGDLPKRLNLLRGFFLWVKQPGEFCPWLDDECLAVYPGSG